MNFKIQSCRKLATLNSLRGSSINASLTCLRTFFLISVMPLNGSMSFPFLSSAIAFIVRSLLRKSSINEVSLVKTNSKPLCPMLIFSLFLLKHIQNQCWVYKNGKTFSNLLVSKCHHFLN